MTDTFFKLMHIEGLSVSDADGQLLLIAKNLEIPLGRDMQPLAPAVAAVVRSAMLAPPTNGRTGQSAASVVDTPPRSDREAPQEVAEPKRAKRISSPSDSELLDQFKTWYDAQEICECERRHGLSVEALRNTSVIKQRTQTSWRRMVSKKVFDETFVEHARRLASLLVARKIIKQGRGDAYTTPIRSSKSDVAFYRIVHKKLKRLI